MKRLFAALIGFTLLIGPAWAGTLEAVKTRGMLICGVNTGVAGFSAPDKQGTFRGLDADYCQALAAADRCSKRRKARVSTLAFCCVTCARLGPLTALLKPNYEDRLHNANPGLPERR